MTDHSPHFDIRELVPPEVWHSRGDRAWQLIDPAAIETLDRLRLEFGPLIVNNWHWGGPRKYSGFRPPNSTVGAPLSQHRFGRAIDCISRTVSADEMREHILAAPEDFPLLTTLELGVSWLHFDCRPAVEPIYTVTP